MNRLILDTYVETQLVPTLEPSDIVIVDNLPARNGKKAEQINKELGAWMLFLPPYSPDLKPINPSICSG